MNFEEIYQKNMAFLKKIHPAMYKEIDTADISNVSLEITKDGEVNVGIDGELLYPKENIKKAIEKQVSNYVKNPTAYYNLPPFSLGEDPYAKIHESYQIEMQNNSAYLKQQNVFKGYKHQTKSMFGMIMYGVGNGQHILQLITQIDIKHMIILDNDFSLIKLSMHTTDWTPIYQYFSRPNYSLNFKIGTDKRDALSATMINYFYLQYPFLTYFLPYYVHYKSKFFEDLDKKFQKKSNNIRTGLGFYDDERTSILHTMQNIKAKRPILQINKKLKKDYSVFILGSGPSIDNDIKYIKKHQNNALILSGGSALPILERNGIVPDFHFEMERNIITKEVLLEGCSPEYLKQINIIGLNLIHPEVYELFNSAYMFCRNNDAGASILGNSYVQLDHCNPTVVNAVFSFCSYIGFKNIYLFGTDMGYVSEESHHSKDSGYYKGDNSLSKWKPKTLKNTIESNFGDKEIYTTPSFVWNKRRLRNAIIQYKENEQQDINYYNCSDGAFVEGTVPLHSKEIKLNIIDKKELINELHSFFIYNKSVGKDILKGFKSQKKQLFDTIDNIDKIISKDFSTFSELFDIIIESRKYITNIITPNHKSAASFSLLRGTLDTMYAKIYTYSLAMENPDKGVLSAKNSFKTMKNFLYRVKKDFNDIEKEYINTNSN